VFHNSGMTTLPTLSNPPLWKLDGTTAILSAAQLSARIDLLNPRAGLHQLVYREIPRPGSVLGVALGGELLRAEELRDVFVRGNDLVVTYAATDQRSFSLQVYWRARVDSKQVVLLDTILSLQTDLLESFPGLAITTKMPAEAIWSVSDAASDNSGAAKELTLAAEQTLSLASDDSDCLLLRGTDSSDSSYAEMTYPEDRGKVEITRATNGEYLLRRELGGAFLEKGVIRCLRVRGVFLPQKEDAKRVAACLVSLAAEQPPLTV